MYQIPVNHKTGKVWYSIYTKDEAEKSNIPYKHWKEVDAGEYALSDDEIVALVISKKTYPHKASGSDSVYLRFPWGYHMFQPKYKNTKLNAMGRKTPHTLSGKSQLEVRAGQDKMKNLAMAYAQTMDYNLSIDMALGSTTPQENRKWKRHMKSEVFKSMVRKELQELLMGHGLTQDATMELLNDTIEMAKNKKDITNLMRAAEKLMDLHGMNDKQKTVTTQSLEAVETKRLIGDIAEEERKLLAQQTEVEIGQNDKEEAEQEEKSG
tara:strand:+ start:2232 stop:3029 length:798 start_codon:yes stop_codon:yes gene_type:complete